MGKLAVPLGHLQEFQPLTTVDGRNPVQPGMNNNGINYQPQLVRDFWTINRISLSLSFWSPCKAHYIYKYPGLTFQAENTRWGLDLSCANVSFLRKKSGRMLSMKYVGCLIGILRMVFWNNSPHNWVGFHPLSTPKQPVFFSLLV